MADSSFYGGTPGYSFIIVMNYESEEEMIECFSQGPSYEAVHYDEHVLINTENKNNEENGRVYRRGYDYSNDMGGAIYVGTIVGPAGPAPHLELDHYDGVVEKQEEENGKGSDYRFSSGSYEVSSQDLVAGKDGSSYNDEIKWACCSVRDENGTDTTAYIGFILPYLVVDFNAESVSPYDYPSGTELAERVDDATHAFFENWLLKIPKGIKGDTFKNIQVIEATDKITISYEMCKNLSDTEREAKKADDIANKRKIVICERWSYDIQASGVLEEFLYVCDYNMIKSIELDEPSGEMTINYTYDDSYTTYLNYIQEMTVTDDYHLIVYYTNPDIRASIVSAGKNYSTGYLIPGSSTETSNEWRDLGSIKDDSGILIGLNISSDDVNSDILKILELTELDLTDMDAVILYLNTLYPYGLTGIDLKGKIITVGDEDTENKIFYAFDYDKQEWYCIGYIEAEFESDQFFMVASEDDEDLTEKQTELNDGGLWFVLED